MPLAQRIACTLCRTGDVGLVETQAFEPQNLTVVGRHSTNLLCRYLQSRWYCMGMSADNYDITMTVDYNSTEIDPGEADYSNDI